MIKKIKEIWNSHVEMLRIQKELKEANEKLKKVQLQQWAKQEVKHFSDYKEAIVKAINERDHGIQEPIVLIEAFVNQDVQFLNESQIISMKYIPTVLFIGENTGRMYFFALNHLLPNLDNLDNLNTK